MDWEELKRLSQPNVMLSLQSSVTKLKACIDANTASLNTAIGNTNVAAAAANPPTKAEYDALVNTINAAIGAANADVAACTL